MAEEKERKETKKRRIIILILLLLLLFIILINVKKFIGNLDNGNSSALDIYSENAKINEELSKKELSSDNETEVGESILEIDDENILEDEIDYTDVVDDVLDLSNTVLTTKPESARPTFRPTVVGSKPVALAKVTSLKFDSKTNILSFSKISNCSGYRIRIVNLATKKVKEVPSTFNRINLGKYVEASAKYNISVKALAANTVKNKDSDYSKILEVDKRRALDTVSNLKYDKEKLSFNSVKGAIKYEIHIRNEITGNIEVIETKGTSCVLNKLASAQHYVKVIAIADNSLGINKNSKASSEIIIDARKTLAKPEGLKAISNDKVITWEKVKNANRYVVKVIDTISGESKMINVEKNEMKFTPAVKSIYTIAVQAVPSNSNVYKMSTLTNKITVDNRLTIAKSSNLVIDKTEKIVSWKAPENAKSFEVAITYHMNDNTTKKDTKIVTKPEFSVPGLYKQYKKLDVKINTIPNSKTLKESGFTSSVCLPYITKVELINPSLVHDHHCLLIEITDFDMMETGKAIVLGDNSFSETFKFSDLKIGGTSKKQLYFEEMSKLAPGKYYIRLEYKVKGVDEIQSSSNAFVVKQGIKSNITRIDEMSDSVKYQIEANENIKEYKLEVLNLDGTIALTDTVLPGTTVDISEKVFAAGLIEGKYAVRFTPVILNTDSYTMTKNSKFEETVEIKAILPEEIIEEAITFSNELETFFIPDSKPGYNFSKFIYTQEVIDGVDKYTFESNPQEMKVLKVNIKDTDVVKVLYVKE